jgi:hypothetical protein
MNDHAATKLWAVIDEYFCAVTAGETPAEALSMNLGNVPNGRRVALCNEGCAGTMKFEDDGAGVSARATRKGPDCATGCSMEIHVEPLTEALWDGLERSSVLDYFLMAPREWSIREPAMSEEEFNIKIAEKALDEARLEAELAG